MSKSSGVDMRGDDGESAVIMVKSLESVSSMSLLLLMNQFQDEPKPFKCAIKAIITYSDEATRTSIEKFTKNLKHLSEVPVVLVESEKKCTITSAKNVIEYLNDSGITWALTGSCTSRIAGEILLHATDGAGEHISIDASAFEQPGGSNARFVRPMRDLSRNEQVNVLKTFTAGLLTNVEHFCEYFSEYFSEYYSENGLEKVKILKKLRLMRAPNFALVIAVFFFKS